MRSRDEQGAADDLTVRHIHRGPLTPDQAADLAGDLSEVELDERVRPICAGPVTDGSRSLSEAAQELHEFAVWLVELEREGWQLVHEAEDAHLHVINRDATRDPYGPAPTDA